MRQETEPMESQFPQTGFGPKKAAFFKMGMNIKPNSDMGVNLKQLLKAPMQLEPFKNQCAECSLKN